MSQKNDPTDPKNIYHYGRGGAGNVTIKDSTKPPVTETQTTPTLKGGVYTTGRGGTGNMAKNDPSKPDEARTAQDVDIPGVTLPEGHLRVGRGGAANVQKLSDEEIADAKKHNEKVRKESMAKAGGSGKMKDLLEKGKEMVSGNK